MSEKFSPKSFDDGDSDYRQFKDMQYRDELLGGAEQGSQRYEEAKAYDEHMKAMEGRSEEDIYNEMTKQPDAVDRAIAAGDPQVRFMKSLADQIAELRNKPVDADRADRDVQALHDKEDSFNTRLAEYENREDADPSVIDRLMELAIEERTSGGTVDADDTTPTADDTMPLMPASGEAPKTTPTETIIDYKDMTDDQKAEFKNDVRDIILHNIEAGAGSMENAAFIQKVVDLRDSLIRDGGIEESEANSVIQAVVDSIYTSAPKLFEATPVATPDAPAAAPDQAPVTNLDVDGATPVASPADANPTQVVPAQAPRDTTVNPATSGQSLDDMEPVRPPAEKTLSEKIIDRLKSGKDKLVERWENMGNRGRLKLALGSSALIAAGVAFASWKLFGDHTVMTQPGSGVKAGLADAILNGGKEAGKAAKEHLTGDPQAFVNLNGNIKVEYGQGIDSLVGRNVPLNILLDLYNNHKDELYTVADNAGNIVDVRILKDGIPSQGLANDILNLANK